MSTSVAEIIHERRAKCDALEAALTLYPDAHISGDYICSASVKAADCDVVLADHTKQGDLLRVGKQLDGVVILKPFLGETPMLLLWWLREKHPELYQQVVRVVATRGGR